jgi:hypothetical protein
LQIFDLTNAHDEAQLRPRLLAGGQHEYYYPCWTHDGKQILFGRGDNVVSRGPSVLASVNADGTGSKILRKNAETELRRPALSRTDRFLAYVEGNSVKARLVIEEFQTGRVLRTIENISVFSAASWSPTDDLVAFRTDQDTIGLYDAGRDVLSAMPIKGWSVIFHPDGKRIFFLPPEDEFTPAISSVEIGPGAGKPVEVIRLSADRFGWLRHRSSGFEELVGFSSDGKYLLYVGYGAAPGIEYKTLGFLDLGAKASWEFYHTGVLKGASWFGAP